MDKLAPKDKNRLSILVNLLQLGPKMSPINDEKDFFILKCVCEFEPHGRASETWEELWILELPQIQFHVKMKNGWKKTDKMGMKFKGRVPYIVIEKAIAFMEIYNETNNIQAL